MNGFKDSLFVGAVPAEPSVADDMVGRYETEMAGIYRLVGIIGQYPIVVLSEKEEIKMCIRDSIRYDIKYRAHSG